MIRGIYKSCIHNDKYIAVFPNGSKWSDVSLMMKILFLLTDLSVDLTSVGRAWTLTQFTTTSWQVPGGNTMFYRYMMQINFYLSSIYMPLCWYIVLILFSYILKILNGKDSEMGLYLIIKNCPVRSPGKSFCIRKNPRLTNEDNMML